MIEKQPPCPFCILEPGRILYENASFRVIRDGFPITPGHTLVTPKQHIASLFELGPEQFLQLRDAIQWVKADLNKEFSPDSYNIGVNDGLEAGQTVPHLHVHIIPRYKGDQTDPRGGIRWIIPEKAKYWVD
ncbi:MAG TPA: HIT family protein [Gammaproteobacteria bacterium]|nr:HIT family protein [Gammaproteobacteria bacterium]